MANAENLIPMDQRSQSEAREFGKKGGKASGEARRRKKTMRQTASMLLGMDLAGGESEFVAKLTSRLRAFGLSEENATYQEVLIASILLKAMKGDVRAAEYIRDIAGESPQLDLKKQELKLRKEELRFKKEQEAKRSESAATEGRIAEAWINALLTEEDPGEDE